MDKQSILVSSYITAIAIVFAATTENHVASLLLVAFNLVLFVRLRGVEKEEMKKRHEVEQDIVKWRHDFEE